MVRRGVSLLLVIVLSMSFMISINMVDVMKSTETLGKQRMYEISYVSHAPFNISSNSDFEMQGWPGNGSAVNPYRIQNLNITSLDSMCIWITNTTNHFIIEDCLFTSPIHEYSINQPIGPITLTNVSNGMIERNYFVDSQAAVSGYSLSNCSISDNILSVSFTGIHISFSNSTVVSNNTQGYEPCDYGLSIYHCRNCTISLNIFRNITYGGMSAWSNYDVQIIENSFTASTDEDSFSWAGIDTIGGILCTIQRNILSNFRWSGIELTGNNYTVQDNNITSCSTGITLSTNNSTVTGNRINGSSSPIVMHQSNDTVVNGNFLSGRSGQFGTGITMLGGHDCDIYSNTISLVYQGLYLQGASQYNVSDNSVTEGRYGFTFGWYSYWGDVPNGPFFNCDIINNTFDGGGLYPIIESYENWDFDTIRFVGNMVQGKPIGFFANLDAGTIDGNSYAQLLLVNCRDITVSGGDFHDISSAWVDDYYYDPGSASAIILMNCTSCDLVGVNCYNNSIGVTIQDSSQCDVVGGVEYDNSWVAISISYSEDIDIANVDIRNSTRGIDINWSYNCYISNCIVRSHEAGIFLRLSMNCTIFHNTVFQNGDGLYLEDSDGADISDNNLYWNDRGVLLNSTSDSWITHNNIHNNTGVGISLDSTSNHNDIFYNTFAYNMPNALCEGSLNHWDNQVDIGNWWSDYSGEGPYIIDENDQDNFPMNEPLTSNGTTTTNGFWITDPLFAGIVIAVVGIIGVAILVAYRRRIAIID